MTTETSGNPEGNMIPNAAEWEVWTTPVAGGWSGMVSKPGKI